MKQLGIWGARIVPLAGLAAHCAGAWHVYEAGYHSVWRWLMTAAWIGFLLYTVGVWTFGDYIQQSLNCKPWGYRDEHQRDAARRAMTFTYMVIVCAAALLLALHLDLILEGGANDLDSMAQNAKALYLQLLTLVYAGAVLPTAYLGWRFRPLASREEA